MRHLSPAMMLAGATLVAAAMLRPASAQLPEVQDFGTRVIGGPYTVSIFGPAFSCPGAHTVQVSVQGAPWLTISGPTTIQVDAGSQPVLDAQIDLTGLTPGSHHATVTFTCATCNPPCPGTSVSASVQVVALPGSTKFGDDTRDASFGGLVNGQPVEACDLLRNVVEDIGKSSFGATPTGSQIVSNLTSKYLDPNFTDNGCSDVTFVTTTDRVVASTGKMEQVTGQLDGVPFPPGDARYVLNIGRGNRTIANLMADEEIYVGLDLSAVAIQQARANPSAYYAFTYNGQLGVISKSDLVHNAAHEGAHALQGGKYNTADTSGNMASCIEEEQDGFAIGNLACAAMGVPLSQDNPAGSGYGGRKSNTGYVPLAPGATPTPPTPAPPAIPPTAPKKTSQLIFKNAPGADGSYVSGEKAMLKANYALYADQAAVADLHFYAYFTDANRDNAVQRDEVADLNGKACDATCANAFGIDSGTDVWSVPWLDDASGLVRPGALNTWKPSGPGVRARFLGDEAFIERFEPPRLDPLPVTFSFTLNDVDDSPHAPGIEVTPDGIMRIVDSGWQSGGPGIFRISGMDNGLWMNVELKPGYPAMAAGIYLVTPDGRFVNVSPDGPVGGGSQDADTSIFLTPVESLRPRTIPPRQPIDAPGRTFLPRGVSSWFLRPASWPAFSTIRTSGRSQGSRTARAAAFGDVKIDIVATGRSSGAMFEVKIADGPAVGYTLAAGDGVALQPIAGRPNTPRVGEPPSQAAILTSNCLDIDKPPPVAGTRYRVADRATQEKYRHVRPIVRSVRTLAEAGRLVPDVGDAKTYVDAIRQWAIWARREGFDESRFTQAFVQHARKNVEASRQRWDNDLEKAFRQLAPGRWRAVQMVLQAAQNPERNR